MLFKSLHISSMRNSHIVYANGIQTTRLEVPSGSLASIIYSGMIT